jgi:DNA-directed RNA polymerase subunit RPC12/RpoP
MTKTKNDTSNFHFTVHEAGLSGIHVRCPFCGKLGIVKTDGRGYGCFRHFTCATCGKTLKRKGRTYVFSVNAVCRNCGRYFRVQIDDETKQHIKILYVHCPHCGNLESAPVLRTDTRSGLTPEIRDGCEPYFGYPLYYQAVFDGKLLWALNRKHLRFLINSIDELAENSPEGECLPQFMKVKENKKALLKLLKKMQAELLPA